MQRVSVTTLEKFRRFMLGLSCFDTEDALIETIKGVFAGNDKTKTGSAYHKLLENDYRIVDMRYQVEADGCIFQFTQMQADPALRYQLRHPLMTREINVSKIYNTAYGPYQVTGRVDGLEGREVHDDKTKFRSFRADEYMDSSQWKFYLDMLDLDIFYYNVFEVTGFKELPATMPYRLDCDFVAHEPIKCERYENMDLEISTQLNQFLDYVHFRGLVQLLKPALKAEYLNF